MTIDIDKIREDYEEEQGDFETLPEDKYPCYVYEVQGQMSSNDNPMLSITLKVAKGEYKNRQIWDNVTLIPKAWWKVEEFFEAVGYDVDNLPAEAESPQEIATAIREDVVGSKIMANIEHRKYQGSTQESVESVEEPEEDFEVEEEGDDDLPF